MTEKEEAEIRQAAHDWVIWLSAGNPDLAGAADLARWCRTSDAHEKAFAEAALLLRDLKDAAKRAKVHQGTGASRSREGGKAIRRRAFVSGGLATAAGLAGVCLLRPPLGLWPSGYELLADYRTAKGKRASFALATGVNLDLNTRTSVNLARDGAAETRHIVLVEGELAIRSSPEAAAVMVTVRHASIDVRDASANIRCDGDRVGVTCLGGTILLKAGSRSVTLAKNEAVAFSGVTVGNAITVDPRPVSSWTDGKLVFDNTPLSQVIAEINRYRPGRVVLVNAVLGDRPVQVTFPLDRLDELLELIGVTYASSIRTLPGGLVLIG